MAGSHVHCSHEALPLQLLDVDLGMAAYEEHYTLDLLLSAPPGTLCEASHPLNLKQAHDAAHGESLVQLMAPTSVCMFQ